IRRISTLSRIGRDNSRIELANWIEAITMRAAAMMMVLAIGAGNVGGGALSVVVRQTQNSRCTKWLLRSLRRRRSQWATRGPGEAGAREIVRCDREKEVETVRERKIEGERENHSGIRGANQNQPFQHTLPLSLFADQHTDGAAYEVHTHMIFYLNKRACEGKVRERNGSAVMHVRIHEVFSLKKSSLFLQKKRLTHSSEQTFEREF
ncbi:hypothetical protein DBV15_09603, partial [Temnothorax longispinosus]